MKDKRFDYRKIVRIMCFSIMCMFEMTLNFYLAEIKTKSSFNELFVKTVVRRNE